MDAVPFASEEWQISVARRVSRLALEGMFTPGALRAAALQVHAQGPLAAQYLLARRQVMASAG